MMPTRKNVRTAVSKHSIWKPISEDHFRRNIVALARITNNVPGDPTMDLGFSTNAQPASISSNDLGLPYEQEKRLANDLAFIAATKEGVGSVTAVCIEERDDHASMLVRVAANEGVSLRTQNDLRQICDIVMACTRDEFDFKVCQARLLHFIVSMNHDRIIDRIRASLGYAPSFIRGPRLVSNHDGIHRALDRMRLSARTKLARKFLQDMRELVTEYTNIVSSNDRVPIDMQSRVAQLEQIVKQSYEKTTAHGKKLLSQVLKDAGYDPVYWYQNKSMMQIYKLAAYWRISRSLAKDAHRSRSGRSLSRIELSFVEPYSSTRSQISSQNRFVSCFVHAEVQIITHYLLKAPSGRWPKTIGTSKSACFLCHMFIKYHGALTPPLTHGRLYDQWTIPDLDEFGTEQRQLLRKLVFGMNDEILKLAKKKWRLTGLLPLTSRHNIDQLPLSSRNSSRTSTVTLNGVNEHQIDRLQTQLENIGIGDASVNASDEAVLSGPNSSPDPIPASRVDENEHLQGSSSHPETHAIQDSRSATFTKDFDEENQRQSQQSLVQSSTEHPNLSASSSMTVFNRYFRFSGLDIIVEFDPAREGEVEIFESSTCEVENNGEIINVKDLEPGRDLLLGRPSTQRHFSVCLHVVPEYHYRLLFEWTHHLTDL